MTASEVIPLITERPLAGDDIPALKALLVECLPLSTHLAGVFEAHAWFHTEIANRSIGFWAGDQLVAVVLKGQVMRIICRHAAPDTTLGNAIRTSIDSRISRANRAVMGPVGILDGLRSATGAPPIDSVTVWERRADPLTDRAAVRTPAQDELVSFSVASFAAFREELGFDPAADPRDPAYLTSWEQAKDQGRILGVWDDLGQCVYRVELRPALGQVAELRGVWLHPSLRGKGLALTYLAETIARVADLGAPSAVVLTRRGNHVAESLYRRAGFAPVGQLGRLELAQIVSGSK